VPVPTDAGRLLNEYTPIMTNTPDDPLSPHEHSKAPIGSTADEPCHYLTWEQVLQDYKDGLLTKRGLRHYQALLKPPTANGDG
jgi:hypothetical protein